MTRSADILNVRAETPKEPRAGATPANTSAGPPQRTESPARKTTFPWFTPRAIPLLLTLAVIVRWIFSAMHQLVPDEAYYWVWSRHLALSYLDHPPMVAYIIRLGTAVLGQTEIGIRWPAAILAMGSIAILARATQRLLNDARATTFVAIALLASPMVQVMGSIITPDTPALFFQSAAVACVLAIFSPPKPAEKNIPQENLSLSRAKLWLPFGLFIGLAMLSKYPSVLVALAITFALLSTREGRRHFLTPWIWLGAAISIAVFSPVLIWNARHQWVSILFQLNHGLGSNDSPMLLNLLTYLGGQLALFTPILFVMVVMALMIFALRPGRDTATRILLFTGAFPLLFFAWSSRHRPAEGNWPYFAYMPGTILLAKYLSQNWQGRRVGWARAGVIVALVMTIGMHLPELIWRIDPKIPSPQWDKMYGWRELAKTVDQVPGHLTVNTEDYEYAAEMSFYMDGQPQVRMLGWWKRPTAYDYFEYPPPAPPTKEQATRYIIVRKISRAGPLPIGSKLQDGSIVIQSIIDPGDKQFGRSVRQSEIIIAEKQQ